MSEDRLCEVVVYGDTPRALGRFLVQRGGYRLPNHYGERFRYEMQPSPRGVFRRLLGIPPKYVKVLVPDPNGFPVWEDREAARLDFSVPCDDTQVAEWLGFWFDQVTGTAASYKRNVLVLGSEVLRGYLFLGAFPCGLTDQFQPRMRTMQLVADRVLRVHHFSCWECGFPLVAEDLGPRSELMTVHSECPLCGRTNEFTPAYHAGGKMLLRPSPGMEKLRELAVNLAAKMKQATPMAPKDVESWAERLVLETVRGREPE